MAEWTKATVLKTVVLRTPVNEWLGPMKEAPSFEGAFLVSATPPSGSHRERELVVGGIAYRVNTLAEPLGKSYPW